MALSSSASRHAASRLGRLADRTFRRRRVVAAAWLAALVVAVGLGAALSGSYSADYSTPGSGSKAALTLLEQRFQGRSDRGADIVWSSPSGARAPAVTRRIDGVLAQVGGLTGIAGRPSTRAAEISPDGRTGVV